MVHQIQATSRNKESFQDRSKLSAKNCTYPQTNSAPPKQCFLKREGSGGSHTNSIAQLDLELLNPAFTSRVLKLEMYATIPYSGESNPSLHT